MRRLLIDSHVFVWMVGRSPHLSGAVADLIEAQDVAPYLSAASIAELCIKINLGKLTLPVQIGQDAAISFQYSLEQMSMECLPVTLAHAARLRDLPLHHRDPFDRLIVAQAMVEGLTVVTHDRTFARYDGLAVLWA